MRNIIKMVMSSVILICMLFGCTLIPSKNNRSTSSLTSIQNSVNGTFPLEQNTTESLYKESSNGNTGSVKSKGFANETSKAALNIKASSSRGSSFAAKTTTGTMSERPVVSAAESDIFYVYLQTVCYTVKKNGLGFDRTVENLFVRTQEYNGYFYVCGTQPNVTPAKRGLFRREVGKNNYQEIFSGDVYGFYIYKDCLYFSYESSIYEVNLSNLTNKKVYTGNKTVLMGTVLMGVINDYFIFQEGLSEPTEILWKVPITGGVKEKMYEKACMGFPVNSVYMFGGMIIIFEASLDSEHTFFIRAFDENGNFLRTLATAEMEYSANLKYHDGYIYYWVSGLGSNVTVGTIYRVKIDGSGTPEIVLSNAGRLITISETHIYYFDIYEKEGRAIINAFSLKNKEIEETYIYS